MYFRAPRMEVKVDICLSKPGFWLPLKARYICTSRRTLRTSRVVEAQNAVYFNWVMPPPPRTHKVRGVFCRVLSGMMYRTTETMHTLGASLSFGADCSLVVRPIGPSFDMLFHLCICLICACRVIRPAFGSVCHVLPSWSFAFGIRIRSESFP
jgi:hypothetical protein